MRITAGPVGELWSSIPSTLFLNLTDKRSDWHPAPPLRDMPELYIFTCRGNKSCKHVRNASPTVQIHRGCLESLLSYVRFKNVKGVEATPRRKRAPHPCQPNCNPIESGP